jgi:hypothetical protein
MQTTFLSALFLTGLGFLLTYYGQFIRVESDTPTLLGINADSARLQFSGAIIAAIFWVRFGVYMLTCMHNNNNILSH